MCGIAGMVDLTGQGQVPGGALQAMAATLAHRGPDDDGQESGVRSQGAGVSRAAQRLTPAP